MSRDLNTAPCIYCQRRRTEHDPSCPVLRTAWEKTWEDLKAWAYVVVVLVGWLMLLGGFREISELIVP